MKTLTVKSKNTIDTIYIFRENDTEVEVRFEQNKVFSDLELTQQEKKDITKLMKFEEPLFIVHKQKTPDNVLIQFNKENNNYNGLAMCSSGLKCLSLSDYDKTK